MERLTTRSLHRGCCVSPACDVPGRAATHQEGALGQAGLSTCAGHLSSVSPARQHGSLLCSQKNGLWIWYLKEVEGRNRKRLTGKTNSPGGGLSAEQTSVWVTAGYAVWGPLPTKAPQLVGCGLYEQRRVVGWR